jgi:RHS repeat-associated protein
LEHTQTPPSHCFFLQEKVVASVSTDSKQREVGYWGKQIFELSNHLGNVLATITDKKLQVSTNNSSTSYFEAEVQSVQDYYAFGMQMPGRKSSGGYRYGFNGKENDNEVKGEGNQQDYGMRIYDGRIGKFLSVDPLFKSFPWYTPYQFAGNTPIQAIDLDGAEPLYIADKTNDGKTHLKFPVAAMFAKLNGNSFWLSGTKANIQINQSVHDRITKYKDGAITLGYEMIFTQNFNNVSPEGWLKLIAHEKVHVNQFISMFGSNFSNQEEYKKAVAHWMVKYGVDATYSWFDNHGKTKDDLHDAIPTEAEANAYEEKFRRFFDGEKFQRLRRVDGQKVRVKENRVLNLLKAIDDAMKKYINAKEDKEKSKQKERYNANYNSLMNLVDKFNEKEKSNKQQNNGRN